MRFPYDLSIKLKGKMKVFYMVRFIPCDSGFWSLKIQFSTKIEFLFFFSWNSHKTYVQ